MFLKSYITHLVLGASVLPELVPDAYLALAGFCNIVYIAWWKTGNETL